MGHKVGVIGGDGIGPEVIAEGLKAIDAAGVELDPTDFDLGGARYLRDGTVLDDATLDRLGDLDAIYLGAVGSPEVASGVLERGLLLRMRFELDLYVNLRPFVADGIDFVVVRENTEGPYVGEGGVLRKGTPHEVATQGSVNTRFGVERCVRFAFDLATGRDRRLTLLHKTNVLTFAGDLWRRTVDEVAADYPEVDVGYHHIDAACIHMVQSPQTYDVIVTDNLFGDIITDLAAAVTGGIGRAASANLNPARSGPSMFEPVHGSAPDIAGTGRADPTAAILSGAMMVEFLGDRDAAAAIRDAVAAAGAAGELTGSTSEVGDAIVARLRRS
jgi:3-isopropylmalate dehydrogenase